MTELNDQPAMRIQVLSPVNGILDEEHKLRLQNIQEIVRRNWEGIRVGIAGMPGNSSIVNKKHLREETSTAEKEEQNKLDLLFEMALKIKELDELKEIRAAHEKYNNASNDGQKANSET